MTNHRHEISSVLLFSSRTINFTKNGFCKGFVLTYAEIKGLENKESPDAKLECVMRCSKLLCHALLIGKKDPGLVSADDLLPATVWMLLRANPHFLHSNIKYVTRFGAPDKVYAGETGYYFANLVSTCVLHAVL